MGVVIEWFKFGPKLEVHVTVTAGVLSLTSSSKVTNPGDFTWNPDQLSGAIYKNGTSAATLTINASTGALTSNSVNVAQDDVIEVRVEYTGNYSWPYHNKLVATRSAFLTVPPGNSTTDFDDSNHKQPVPEFELAFGWDSNSKLKVGFKISSADGADQSMTASTRLLPDAEESSTSVSLSNTSTVQNHTSTFTSSQATGDFEIRWVLASGSGNPKQQDRLRLVFQAKELVATYPPNFPSSDVSLVQVRSGAKVRIGAPGQ